MALELIYDKKIDWAGVIPDIIQLRELHKNPPNSQVNKKVAKRSSHA
jgi:hypothetical protein